jgi:hypothetical protein
MSDTSIALAGEAIEMHAAVGGSEEGRLPAYRQVRDGRRSEFCGLSVHRDLVRPAAGPSVSRRRRGTL